MNSILRRVFSSGHDRRRAATLALWLLRQVRAAEDEDMERYADLLDSFESDLAAGITPDYEAAEDACLSSEYALGLLDSAIGELEFLKYT